MSLWTPGEDLVTDLRHALAHAPRATAEDRFEAWAWRALLDEDGPALLTRHAAPAHVTASAFVLSADARRVVLVLHGKLGAWVQPGGHLEEGDTSLAGAAAREVREETGLTARVRDEPVHLSRHAAPCNPGVVDWHLDVEFVAVAEDDEQIATSHECDDVAWFAVDALPGDLAPGVPLALTRAVAWLRADQSAAAWGSAPTGADAASAAAAE